MTASNTGVIPDAVDMGRQITIAFGKNREDKRWANETVSLGKMVEGLTTHTIGPKDGKAFLQGSVVETGERYATAMAENSLIILDIDNGMPSDDVDALIRKSGLFCVRYSTHSHGRAETEIKEADWTKWQTANSGATVGDYLVAKKRYLSEIAATATLGQRKHGKGGFILPVSHAAMDKNRLVFVLAKSWKAEQDGRTHTETMAQWRDAYLNFARWLGVDADKSCADPSRLMYLPRHDVKPAKVPEAVVHEGSAVDIFTLPRVEASASAPNVYSATAVAMGAKDGKPGERLKGWAATHGVRFQIYDAIMSNDPDRLRPEKDHDDVRHIECPFEDEHTASGGSGTYVVNAGVSRAGGFVIKCMHASCADRDRLEHLDKMICDGWFEDEARTDPEYLDDVEEEEAAPKVDPALVEATMRKFLGGVLKDDEEKAKAWAHMLTKQLAPLNERYAVAMIEGQGRILDLDSIRETAEERANPILSEMHLKSALPSGMTTDSFRLLHKTQDVAIQRGEKPTKLDLGEAWLEWPGRRTYANGLIFAPGVADVGSRLNLFTGWGVAPTKGRFANVPTLYTEEDREADAGECSLFLEHLKTIICDDNEGIYQWLLWWLAQTLQEPTKRPPSAVVLHGKKGTGKSIVADVMRKIIGDRASYVASKKDELVGGFNGHLAGKLWLNCEEVMFGGDVQANNVLKVLVTAPVLAINAKFLPSFNIPPTFRMIFTTNEKFSHATSEDERRYLFLTVREDQKDKEEYFDALFGQLDAGGYQALSDYLFNFIPADGISLRRPPRTERHAELVMETLQAEEKFFAWAAIDGEDYPDDAQKAEAVIFVEDVRDSWIAYLSTVGAEKSRKLTDKSYVTSMMVKWWGATDKAKRRQAAASKESPRASFKIPKFEDARARLVKSVKDGGMGLSLPPLDAEE